MRADGGAIQPDVNDLVTASVTFAECGDLRRTGTLRIESGFGHGGGKPRPDEDAAHQFDPQGFVGDDLSGAEQARSAAFYDLVLAIADYYQSAGQITMLLED